MHQELEYIKSSNYATSQYQGLDRGLILRVLESLGTMPRVSTLAERNARNSLASNWHQTGERIMSFKLLKSESQHFLLGTYFESASQA